LADFKLLRQIDYLSTVSGGGYFGGFLGALFRRRDVDTPADAESVLAGRDVTSESTARDESEPVRFLRENGRYLAPAGTDDLFVAGAVLLRNLLAVHTAIFSYVLMWCFLLHVGVCYALEALGSAGTRLRDAENMVSFLWLSPFVFLGVAVLIGAALPYGWSYWLIDRSFRSSRKRQSSKVVAVVEFLWQVLPLILGMLGSVAVLRLTPNQTSLASLEAALVSASTPQALIAWLLFLVPLFTGLSFSLARTRFQSSGWFLPYAITAAVCGAALAWVGNSYGRPLLVMGFVSGALALTYERYRWHRLRLEDSVNEAAESSCALTDRNDAARDTVSKWLTGALLVAGALLTIGFVDTAARTIYVKSASYTTGLFGAVAGLLGSLLAFGRKFTIWAGSTFKHRRLGPKLGWGLRVAAFAVLAFLLVVVHSVAYAIVLNDYEWLSKTAETPANSAQSAAHGESPQQQGPNTFIQSREKAEARLHGTEDNYERRDKTRHNALAAAAVAAIVSFLYGTSRLFLNHSTQHPLYSARLTRTFLGGANPIRTPRAGKGPGSAAQQAKRALEVAFDEPDAKAATRVMTGDDHGPEQYWAVARGDDEPTPFERGAPLHLINVTINETIDGRSQ